jgi:hypothetical protein
MEGNKKKDEQVISSLFFARDETVGKALSIPVRKRF